MSAVATARNTYRMLANESLWDVAERTHELLANEGIAHAIVGGVAVCLHGYRRNTVDLDLLLASDETDAFRAALEAGQFEWKARQREFRSPSGIAVQALIAGESAGKGQSVLLPDPNDARAVTVIEGLPVLTLKKLIEVKLACGLGDLRRTHKDFADVVELIAANRLDKSFVRYLHPSVRAEFKELAGRVS